MLSSIPVGCVQGAIRLMGGANSMTGRVEICNRNIWGTVCDDSWGTSDAIVACRQLEFSDVGMFYCPSRILENPGQTIVSCILVIHYNDDSTIHYNLCNNNVSGDLA